jgi:signal transduction histidine kinase
VVGLVLETDDSPTKGGYREYVRPPPAPAQAASPRSGLIARILAIPPVLTDVALAVGVALLTANLAVTSNHPEPLGGTLLLVASAAALAVRRRWPLPVLAATLVPYVITRHTGPGQPAVLVALYTVASRCPQPTAIAAAAIAAAASVMAVIAHDDTASVAGARLLAVVVAALAGLAVAERRCRREHERDMLAEIAAADERVRIARELHDLVAHHLSVIVVQANLVGETIGADDPASEPALSIVAAGREALADMRRVLGVLRTHDDPNERTPQPGLADLDQLLKRIRATGLDVELIVDGDADGLPAGLDLSAYRIVQEALTNILRHAQASQARVRLTYRQSSLALDITDDGVGPADNGSESAGQGLAGMRERATLFGGTLDAGPNPGRGYRVRAELPR